MPSQRAAFLFDLDGTLVDSVYQQCSPGVRHSRLKTLGSRSGASIARSV